MSLLSASQQEMRPQFPSFQGTTSGASSSQHVPQTQQQQQQQPQPQPLLYYHLHSQNGAGLDLSRLLSNLCANGSLASASSPFLTATGADPLSYLTAALLTACAASAAQTHRPVATAKSSNASASSSLPTIRCGTTRTKSRTGPYRPTSPATAETAVSSWSTGKRARNTITGRVCAECRTSHTLQWRQGPDGQASLCNACGQRFQRRKQAQLQHRQQKHKQQQQQEVHLPEHPRDEGHLRRHNQGPKQDVVTMERRSNIYSLLN